MRYLLFLSLFLISGCQDPPADLNQFRDIFFPVEDTVISIGTSGRTRLPFAPGEIDPDAMFVSPPSFFFFSRASSRIYSYNLRNSDVKSYRCSNPPDSFCIGKESVYYADSQKGKVVELSFDLSHARNFIGQLNEDQYGNGHHIFPAPGGLLVINYDFPGITFFSCSGEKICEFDAPVTDLKYATAFENRDILLFYTGKVQLYSPKGTVINQIEQPWKGFAAAPDGLYLLIDRDISYFDNKLKQTKRYLTRNYKAASMKIAATPCLYFLHDKKIYHLLENGQTDTLHWASDLLIDDYLPVYDGNFLIRSGEELLLYSPLGEKLNEYHIIQHYYDLFVFEDNKGNYFTADFSTGILKVISEAAASVFQSVLYDEKAFDRDSNLITDHEGNIYYVDHSTSNVEKISPRLKNSTFEGKKPLTRIPVRDISQILADSSNNLYIFSTRQQTVLKYSSAGMLVFQLGNLSESSRKEALFQNARVIALDSLSQLYVIEDENIFLFSPQGDFQKKIPAPRKLSPPLSASFDNRNLLWIKDLSGMTVFDPLRRVIYHPGLDHNDFSAFSLTENGIAFLYSELGKLELSVSDRTDPVFTGIEAYRTHRYKEASELLSECLAVDGVSPVLAFYLANCYVQLGNFAEARAVLDRKFDFADNNSLKDNWAALKKALEGK